MAKVYKATIQVRCWKQHECVGCGGRFRYLFQRQITGQSSTEAGAAAAAQKAVAAALANQVDFHPCPHCGEVQPEMIAARRVRRHGWGLVLGAVALGVLIILGATDVVSFPAVGRIAACVAAALLAWHLGTARWDPNRDREGNGARSASQVQSGRLVLDAPGGQTDSLAAASTAGLTAGQLVGLGLLAAGLAAVASSEVLRAASGWVINADWHPAVVGPGDQAYTYFDDKVQSIKGLWDGTPSAKVLNAQALGLPTDNLPATTNHGTWGMTIEADSGEKGSRSAVWEQVQVPARAELAGKSLELELTVIARFPVLRFNDQFEDEEQTFQQHRQLQLSAPHAGTTYRACWWGGQFAGAALFLAGSITLLGATSALRKRGNPTNVLPV